jgi:hypothetical protein
LLKLVALPVLGCSVVIAVWAGWPGFSLDAFLGAFLGLGLLIGTIGLLYVVIKVDAAGSTYCKDLLMQLEPSEQDLTAYDASGARVGALSQGTLRLVRVNIHRGKMGLEGGLRLDSARGSVWLNTLQRMGAWPGLRAEPSVSVLHTVEDALFDALLPMAN